MLTASTILKHYKRKDVQEAIVAHVKDREVAPRFNETFGSRPDSLRNGADILEYAKDGATSFHCSEERWSNPHQLATEMKPHELAALRIGWDLIIDIDCKSWEYSKLIAFAIVTILKSFGIASISVKFSGNKGFHIGVPFEAFPNTIHGKETRLLFPEGPRRIAAYLIHLLETRFGTLLQEKEKSSIAHSLNIPIEDLMVSVCVSCNKKHPVSQANSLEFICPFCENRFTTGQFISYKSCDKCGKLMVKSGHVSQTCSRCGKNRFQAKLDVEKILEIDTVLISSRHLYRAPYSLHEKSGLVSLPIDPNHVLDFQKDSAKPENITLTHEFLSRAASPEETKHLFLQAFDFTVPEKEEKILKTTITEVPSTAIPEQYFPDCIKKISKGLVDGKKRAVFILINFLRSVGWTPEQVEQYVHEWNKRNPEPLRENYLLGQLRYARTKSPILPPNCSNTAYYQSLGIKCAENVCMRCKNPVNRAKRAVRFQNVKETSNPKKSKKTEKEA